MVIEDATGTFWITTYTVWWQDGCLQRRESALEMFYGRYTGMGMRRTNINKPNLFSVFFDF